MEGFKIITNGTDNHIVLVDVKKSVNLTGKEAEKILYDIGITCNKNLIPYDTTTPYITSGIRLGTSAMTTRGLKEKDFLEIGKIIAFALKNSEDKALHENLKNKVKKICESYKVYEDIKYE